MFHHFLIWALIAELHPFEVLIWKSLLSLFLVGRLKNFLEIKYVNSYWYTSIQMKCQGGVIFVHAPRLFYYPKRRIGHARCSLTGNKNYPAITKLTNTMKGYATSWHAVWPQNIHVASHISCLWATAIDEWIDDTQLYVLIESISVIQDDVSMILWKAGYS